MEGHGRTSQPLIEQRLFPRLHLKTAIQRRNISKPSQPFSGSLFKNVSASGLCLTADGFLAKESRWVLLVSMPSVLREPIRLIGQVVWSKQQPLSDACECGIQFVGVTADDKGTIADFVERGVVPVVS